MPDGSSVDGAMTRTRAPSALSSRMLERATRECSMSPQIATVSPESSPLWRRMVSASSSAWVGCSCAPSPALITEQPTFCASSSTAPAELMAHDQHVRPHGVQRHRRVDQRLALLHRGGRDRHVHDVGAEPLAGELERGLRARRCFEEQVDLRAARAAPPSSSRPGAKPRQPRRRGRADRSISGGERSRDAQQVAVARRRRECGGGAH